MRAHVYLQMLILCLIGLGAQAQIPLSKSSSETELQAGFDRRDRTEKDPLIRDPFQRTRDSSQGTRSRSLEIGLEGQKKETSHLDIEKRIRNRITIQKSQGGVGDGGGTGIACISMSGEDQRNKKSLVDAEGRLLPEYRETIHQLWITDMHDDGAAFPVFRRNSGFILPLATDTPESYLNRLIDERLQPLSPRFARLLREALYQVRREIWVPVPEGLPLMQDLGSTPSLERYQERVSLCPIVQIVRRKEVADFQTGLSKVVGIEYDPDLFNRFLPENARNNPNYGILPQAMLLLHEALYAMGTSKGHVTSVRTRGLTRMLVEKDLYDFVKSNFDFLYVLYAYGFLDLPFFGYDPKASIELAASKKLWAFGEILDRMSEMRRSRMVQMGFDCDLLENQWSDLNCLMDAVLSSFDFKSDFHEMKVSWYSLFSEDEYRKFDKSFAFLWTIPLKNTLPDIETQLREMHAGIPQKHPMFEELLLRGGRGLEVMRSLCPNIKGRQKLNRKAQGFFRQDANRDMKLQEIILKKAVSYCEEQSAL